MSVQRWAWLGASVGMALGAALALAQPDDRPGPETAHPAFPKAPERKPGSPKADDPAPEPARPALHPVITEILYAVPTGEGGDASGDGVRHVSGDEFVEIVNPHDQPVQMLGYVLMDNAAAATRSQRGVGGGRRGGGSGGLRFVFPAFELPPRGVVVVFNGNGAAWAGPVGDAKGAPAKPDAKFGGAFVFTMRQSSQRVALGNASDAVILSGPDGAVVQRVRWGKAADGTVDAKIALDETAPVVSKGSVTRMGTGKDVAWQAHTDIDLKPFSPGVQIDTKPAPEPPTEGPKPSPKP